VLMYPQRGLIFSRAERSLSCPFSIRIAFRSDSSSGVDQRSITMSSVPARPCPAMFTAKARSRRIESSFAWTEAPRGTRSVERRATEKTDRRGMQRSMEKHLLGPQGDGPASPRARLGDIGPWSHAIVPRRDLSWPRLLVEWPSDVREPGESGAPPAGA